jgi:hypothetical protein
VNSLEEDGVDGWRIVPGFLTAPSVIMIRISPHLARTIPHQARETKHRKTNKTAKQKENHKKGEG